jgi:hypothetical protein
MESAKIIARYRDGRIEKGYSRNFFPNKLVFHLSKDLTRGAVDLKELHVKEMKALFFVKDFYGNPNYRERKTFIEGDRLSGRKVQITFSDGEVMQGSVLGYNPQQAGFFFFPVDPKGNNDRAFVVNASIKDFQYL